MFQARSYGDSRFMPGVAICVVSAMLTYAAPPVAVERTAQVVKVMDQLASTDGSFLIGQSIGHSNAAAEQGFHDMVVRLQESTLQMPAMLGLDYGYDAIPVTLSSSNRVVKRFAEEGGLVTISMHPPNPWKRTGVHDTRIGDYEDLTHPGTLAYRRWRVYLDRVARGLAELRDAEVVVLWRPLHEMNGGWFWWCPGAEPSQWPTPEQFETLWRDMHTYFTSEKQLDNLIWVYSAAVQTSDDQKSATYYYPGNDVVDVVGLDWYVSDYDELDRLGSFGQMASLGKPLGLTEYGPQRERNGSFNAAKLLQVTAQHPEITFALFWHSWPGNRMALVDIENAGKLLSDRRAITLDALKRRQTEP